MFSVDTAVNYFLNKKFGFALMLAPTLEALRKSKDIKAERSKETIDIDSYQKTLRALPVDELQNKYQQALAEDVERAKHNALAEAKSWCFNLPSANADFAHWSKAAHWTLDEAIALSFAKEPDKVNWVKIEKLKEKSQFVKEYAKRHDLAKRAVQAKKLNDPVMPLFFISWAKELNIELPSELIAELEKVGNTAINWRKEWLSLKAKYEELQTQTNHSNLGNTQKTENLLKAFASIAIDAYGYDPKSQKSTTTNDILKALKCQGKTLDPKTIRTWLKEGIDLLPSKPL